MKKIIFLTLIFFYPLFLMADDKISFFSVSIRGGYGFSEVGNDPNDRPFFGGWNSEKQTGKAYSFDVEAGVGYFTTTPGLYYGLGVFLGAGWEKRDWRIKNEWNKTTYNLNLDCLIFSAILRGYLSFFYGGIGFTSSLIWVNSVDIEYPSGNKINIQLKELSPILYDYQKYMVEGVFLEFGFFIPIYSDEEEEIKIDVSVRFEASLTPFIDNSEDYYPPDRYLSDAIIIRAGLTYFFNGLF